MTRKKNTIITLNQRTIETLPIPESRTTIYYDSKEDKLYLAITPFGTKTFYLLSRVQGHRVARIKIGRFPDVKVEKAREIAQKLKASIVLGEDPEKNKTILKGDITFKELFDMYMDKYAKDNHKSWKIAQCVINKHCKHFFNRKLTTITNKEMKEFIITLSKESKNTANTILKKMRSIFNKGKEWEVFKGENPLQNIKSYPEVRRDRFVRPNELADFFSVLDEAPENLKDIVMLGIYTGARKSNILSMEWNECDFQNNYWEIPASKSKNGEKMTIPLLQEAKDILLKRKSMLFQQQYHKCSKDKAKLRKLFERYVFPSPRNKTGHLMDFRKLWNEFRKNFFARRKGQSEGIRFHDMRRTIASFEAMTGQSTLQIIAKSLGHKNTASTEIYARLMLDPVRQSMINASQLMKSQMVIPSISQSIQGNKRLSNSEREITAGNGTSDR